ncbi:MAG TPA: tetratricopeptide repeat protein [Burkholderiaceae bacterium]|nr:tetratricopeptide repeat protein [Burkholderiaceae bacterium]
MEVHEATFERDVLEASRVKPVLVDFWAPWCGPCRALGPLLERLETEFDGRFALVKINSDENPELSAAFGVRSIPFVLAFVDGKAVDSFVGAQPEGVVRRFIERRLPDPSDVERRKAVDLLAEGRTDDAIAALRAAVALAPAGDEARLDLAGVLLDHGTAPPGERLDEARRLLDGVSRAARQEARWKAIDLRARSLRQAASLPASAALEARIAAEPSDLQARFDLAERHVAARRFEAALEQLLEIVSRDRAFADDGARRMMLSVFELAADQPALVSAFRRRLAAVLNR